MTNTNNLIMERDMTPPSQSQMDGAAESGADTDDDPEGELASAAVAEASGAPEGIAPECIAAEDSAAKDCAADLAAFDALVFAGQGDLSTTIRHQGEERAGDRGQVEANRPVVIETPLPPRFHDGEALTIGRRNDDQIFLISAGPAVGRSLRYRGLAQVPRGGGLIAERRLTLGAAERVEILTIVSRSPWMRLDQERIFADGRLWEADGPTPTPNLAPGALANLESRLQRLPAEDWTTATTEVRVVGAAAGRCARNPAR